MPYTLPDGKISPIVKSSSDRETSSLRFTSTFAPTPVRTASELGPGLLDLSSTSALSPNLSFARVTRTKRCLSSQVLRLTRSPSGSPGNEAINAGRDLPAVWRRTAEPTALETAWATVLDILVERVSRAEMGQSDHEDCANLCGTSWQICFECVDRSAGTGLAETSRASETTVINAVKRSYGQVLAKCLPEIEARHPMAEIYGRSPYGHQSGAPFDRRTQADIRAILHR